MGKLKSYYREISAWLPCGGRLRREIMCRIRSNVAAYLEENPDANMEEIEYRFGAPKEIAAAYVSDLDAGELLAALRVRRQIVAAIMTIALFIAASWSGILAWAVHEANNTYDGHTEDAIIEGVWQEGVDYGEFFE